MTKVKVARWTTGEETKLLDGMRRGLSNQQISEILGRRSPMAVDLHKRRMRAAGRMPDIEVHAPQPEPEAESSNMLDVAATIDLGAASFVLSLFAVAFGIWGVLR